MLWVCVVGLHYGSPAFSPPSPMRCGTASMQHSMPHSMPTSFLPSTSPPVFSHMAHVSILTHFELLCFHCFDFSVVYQ